MKRREREWTVTWDKLNLAGSQVHHLLICDNELDLLALSFPFCKVGMILLFPYIVELGKQKKESL